MLRRMRRPHIAVALTAFALALAPSVAFAEVQPPPAHWTARYALPLFIGDALLLLAIGQLASTPLRGIGQLLWVLFISAGGGLIVYGLPYAANGLPWHLPAFFAGMGLLAYAGERSRAQLARESD